VIDIINELKEYTPNILVHNPHADPEKAKKEYGIDLVSFDEMKNLSALVIIVGHEEFRHLIPEMLSGVKLVVDVKGRLDKLHYMKIGIEIFRI